MRLGSEGLRDSNNNSDELHKLVNVGKILFVKFQKHAKKLP